MSLPKILVSDKLSEVGLRVLKEDPGIEYEYNPGMNEDDLCRVIGDFDGLIIRSATTVSPKVLEHADRLKVVGRAGIGVDNVDLGVASKNGIVVMNTPTGNAVTTAEHAISLLLSLARKIPQASASTRSGKWEKSKFQGAELTGKTLGIIGLGNIGRIVATRALGLKLNVIAVDPVISSDKATKLGVELVKFEELLERSDFITIHTPLTKGTKGLFNKETFGKVKPNLLLVNAARGGIVDELALAEAIEAGKLAGAALDVFEKEPIDPAHPLLKLDNVICTPHLGASTKEAQERVAVEIAKQVSAYLKDGTIENSVNVPSMPSELAAKLVPYQKLARKLGLLLCQLDSVDVREFRVTCTGEASELGVAPIAHAALSGYLERHMQEPVNPISAPFEAKERGINLVEVKEEGSPAHGHFTSIRITITGEKGIHTATGTVGNKSEPRLIGLEGYEVDAVLEGNTLLIWNEDRPGVIGAIGTKLGEKGINVSQMQVSLDDQSGQALALWNVESDVTEDTIEELRKGEHVNNIIAIKL